MSVVFTVNDDLNWKGFSMCLCCVAFLIANIRLRPYEDRATHHFENLSLGILVVLSVTTLPQLSHSEFAAQVFFWVFFLGDCSCRRVICGRTARSKSSN